MSAPSYLPDEYFDEHYASGHEVREWARSKGFEVAATGKPSKALIRAWDRAHPSRPYHHRSRTHGTLGAYTNRGCRCDACTQAARNYERIRRGGAA